MKRLLTSILMLTLVGTLAVGCATGGTTATTTMATTPMGTTPMATTAMATTAMTTSPMPAETMPTSGMMKGYVDVTPAEAKALIDSMPALVIIDVSPNYANGHLPGAINYYVGDGSLDKAIPMLDKTATYLVYCHSDSASIAGAQKLVDAGFTTVYRLSGNYSAWVAAGYAIEK